MTADTLDRKFPFPPFLPRGETEPGLRDPIPACHASNPWCFGADLGWASPTVIVAAKLSDHGHLVLRECLVGSQVPLPFSLAAARAFAPEGSPPLGLEPTAANVCWQTGRSDAAVAAEHGFRPIIRHESRFGRLMRLRLALTLPLSRLRIFIPDDRIEIRNALMAARIAITDNDAIVQEDALAPHVLDALSYLLQAAAASVAP